MSDEVTADDLTRLAESFGAALEGAALTDTADTDAADTDAALIALGWHDLLVEAGAAGFEPVFTALGRTAATANILDDVVAAGLGLDVGADTCVVHPAPHGANPPGVRDGAEVVIDGIVSGRYDCAGTMIVPLDDSGVRVVPDPTSTGSGGLDPWCSHRRIRAVAAVAGDVEIAGSYDSAVADARIVLACELLGAARWMLDTAVSHAVDRVQFGRAIASFQAVRHKLADCLAAVEGAEAVVRTAPGNDDPLLAAVAKSLAGRAALTTARHTQQVLGGIGFTADHPFHLRFKRVLTLDTLYGSADSLPAEIGAELLGRGVAPRLVEL